MTQAIKDKLETAEMPEAEVDNPGRDGSWAPSSGASEIETTGDFALVARAQRGDKEAFKELVQKYQARACRLAYTVVKNRAESEDVAQEAFVKAYLSLADFENKSSFFTWLYRIVVNLAIDHRRKVARRGNEQSFDHGPQPRDGNEEIPVSDVLADDGPNPEEKMIGKESISALQRSFDSLSPEHRAVVVLREVDGLSYDEIADSLGVAKGTVMSRLFYARKKLHDDVNKE